mmetsp:Transcript_1465/g.3038  ORF Transcript_1465/g.3038 Transcript_1465/m.3038 type:complete len:171 (+) Transcript_1465:64-576(+)
MSHVARTAVVAARASQNGVARAVPRAVATQPAAATTLVQRRWQSSGKVDRPLSPHLTIYRFGLNAITSVGHRGTGMFMAGALGSAGIGLMVSSHDLAYFIEAMRDTGFMLPLAKMAVAGPLSYHFMTGVRHVLWDNIIAHNLNTSYNMSYGIIALSGAITLGAAFVECDA